MLKSTVIAKTFGTRPNLQPESHDRQSGVWIKWVAGKGLYGKAMRAEYREGH